MSERMRACVTLKQRLLCEASGVSLRTQGILSVSILTPKSFECIYSDLAHRSFLACCRSRLFWSVYFCRTGQSSLPWVYKKLQSNAHVRNRMNMNETGESMSTMSLRQFESLIHFGGRLSIGFAKQMVNVWMQDDTHGAQRYLTKEQAFKNHVSGWAILGRITYGTDKGCPSILLYY